MEVMVIQDQKMVSVQPAGQDQIVTDFLRNRSRSICLPLQCCDWAHRDAWGLAQLPQIRKRAEKLNARQACQLQVALAAWGLRFLTLMPWVLMVQMPGQGACPRVWRVYTSLLGEKARQQVHLGVSLEKGILCDHLKDSVL